MGKRFFLYYFHFITFSINVCIYICHNVCVETGLAGVSPFFVHMDPRDLRVSLLCKYANCLLPASILQLLG